MEQIRFSKHCIREARADGFDIEDIRLALRRGRVIELDDRDGMPFRLVLHWVGARPIHVAAMKTEDGWTHVRTVYCPDPAQWSHNYSKRKS